MEPASFRTSRTVRDRDRHFGPFVGGTSWLAAPEAVPREAERSNGGWKHRVALLRAEPGTSPEQDRLDTTARLAVSGGSERSS